MVLYQLTLANIKMIIRNRQALFWALAFPFIFLLVFGLFIRSGSDDITIGVVDYAKDDVSRQLIDDLGRVETFDIDLREDEEQAREEVRDGDLRYLLIVPEALSDTVSQAPPAQITLVYDDTNPTRAVVTVVIQRFLDKVNLDLADAPTGLELSIEGVLSRDVDFLDFVLPGIALWGVMSFSIIGIATTLASYKEKKILKRILATPLKVRTFFFAQVLAYLLLSLVQAATILGFGSLIFDVSIGGNILYIALLIIMGNIVFLNLGFIVGAYSKNVSAASGLGNAVVVPLIFFSGVFFPTDSLPEYLRRVVEFLPLAPVLEAIRGVMLEAEPLWNFPLELLIVGVWIGVTSIVAVRTFRFQ